MTSIPEVGRTAIAIIKGTLGEGRTKPSPDLCQERAVPAQHCWYQQDAGSVVHVCADEDRSWTHCHGYGVLQSVSNSHMRTWRPRHKLCSVSECFSDHSLGNKLQCHTNYSQQNSVLPPITRTQQLTGFPSGTRAWTHIKEDWKPLQAVQHQAAPALLFPSRPKTSGLHSSLALPRTPLVEAWSAATSHKNEEKQPSPSPPIPKGTADIAVPAPLSLHRKKQQKAEGRLKLHWHTKESGWSMAQDHSHRYHDNMLALTFFFLYHRFRISAALPRLFAKISIDEKENISAFCRKLQTQKRKIILQHYRGSKISNSSRVCLAYLNQGSLTHHLSFTLHLITLSQLKLWATQTCKCVK